MDKKLAQFKAEIKLGQEEVAAKLVTITVVSYTATSHEFSWPSAACADLVASLSMIIYSALRVSFSCVLFFKGLFFVGLFTP